jgi:hypothetical protein
MIEYIGNREISVETEEFRQIVEELKRGYMTRLFSVSQVGMTYELRRSMKFQQKMKIALGNNFTIKRNKNVRYDSVTRMITHVSQQCFTGKMASHMMFWILRGNNCRHGEKWETTTVELPWNRLFGIAVWGVVSLEKNTYKLNSLLMNEDDYGANAHLTWETEDFKPKTDEEKSRLKIADKAIETLCLAKTLNEVHEGMMMWAKSGIVITNHHYGIDVLSYDLEIPCCESCSKLCLEMRPGF